jgi:hypothetical protein
VADALSGDDATAGPSLEVVALSSENPGDRFATGLLSLRRQERIAAVVVPAVERITLLPNVRQGRASLELLRNAL